MLLLFLLLVPLLRLLYWLLLELLLVPRATFGVTSLGFGAATGNAAAASCVQPTRCWTLDTPPRAEVSFSRDGLSSWRTHVKLLMYIV